MWPRCSQTGNVERCVAVSTDRLSALPILTSQTATPRIYDQKGGHEISPAIVHSSDFPARLRSSKADVDCRLLKFVRFRAGRAGGGATTAGGSAAGPGGGAAGAFAG